MSKPVITLQGILSGIRTTVDGGWKLTFDIPQSEVSAIMKLSVLRDQTFAVAVVPSELIQETDPLSVLDQESEHG